MTFNQTFNTTVRKPLKDFEATYYKTIKLNDDSYTSYLLDRAATLIPGALTIGLHSLYGGKFAFNPMHTLASASIYLVTQLGVTLGQEEVKTWNDGFVKSSCGVFLDTLDILNDAILQSTIITGLDIGEKPPAMLAAIKSTNNQVTLPNIIKTFEKDLHVALFGGKYELNGYKALTQTLVALPSNYLGNLVSQDLLGSHYPETIFRKVNNIEYKADCNPFLADIINALVTGTSETFLNILLEGKELKKGDFTQALQNNVFLTFAYLVANDCLGEYKKWDHLKEVPALFTTKLVAQLMGYAEDITYHPELGFEDYNVDPLYI